MKYVRLWTFILLILAPYSPAVAQWQVPQYSVPVGRGGGASGFGSAAPGAQYSVLVSTGPTSNPVFQPILSLLNTVCTAIPSTCNFFFGSTNPAWYGALANGVADDAAPIRAAMAALNAAGHGTLRLSAATYKLCSLGANGALINNYSNVDIVGVGASSVLRFCDGLNTSSASFVFGIWPASGGAGTPVNNVHYRDFSIDMNGPNNDCSGTCFAYNVGLGALYGDRITVRGVSVINNPGSQGIAFGTNSVTPTVNNLIITESQIENACDNFNPACTDHSALWTRATNALMSNNVILGCGPTRGTGIELHGFNVAAVGNTIANCSKGIIMAADATNNVNVSANGNVILNAYVGIDIWCVNTFGYTGAQANNNVVYLSSNLGGGGAGIDASTHVGGSSAFELQINGNVISSDIGAPVLAANFFTGIKVSLWNAASVNGNVVSNIGGPGIYFTGQAIGGVSQYSVIGNVIKDVGRIATPTGLRSGILFDMTGTAELINVQTNSVTNSSAVFATTGVSGSTNAGAGLIAGNTTANVTTPTDWSGTGVAVGVVCSGAPSGSFASLNGVVTHC